MDELLLEDELDSLEELVSKDEIVSLELETFEEESLLELLELSIRLEEFSLEVFSEVEEKAALECPLQALTRIRANKQVRLFDNFIV